MAKKVYRIYDEKNKKEIGAFTSSVAEKQIGIPKNRVSTYARTHSRYQNRYSIQEVKEKSMTELLSEFDQIRRRLLGTKK